MKLITKEIEKKLEKYPLYSQDGKGDDAVVIAKFFGGSCWSWYATEGNKTEDGDIEFYGLIVGDYEVGLGYFYLSELEKIKFPPFGLGVERDKWFSGTIADAKKDARVA